MFEGGGEGFRALVEEVVQALMGAEADQHFGAPWNAKGLPRPKGYRNGLKERDLCTRVGTIRLRLPQARNGSFYPSCLERWQTSERALAATLGEMVSKGGRPGRSASSRKKCWAWRSRRARCRIW